MIPAKVIQRFLNGSGGYGLTEDGVFGPKSMAAGRDFLADRRWTSTFSDARTYIQLEQAFLSAVLKMYLLPDGIDGPKTQEARASYERLGFPTSAGTGTLAPAPPSPPSIWPKQRDVPAFFGEDPRNISVAYVTPAYQLYADYRRRPEHRVSRFQCHKKVKPALTRIFAAALDHYGAEELRRLDLDIFSGCRVVRRITGGTGYSMHSWGIAVDIDAANNEFRDTWKSGVMDHPDRKFFVDLWYKEGAINLGRERNYDPMHFQFARL